MPKSLKEAFSGGGGGATLDLAPQEDLTRLVVRLDGITQSSPVTVIDMQGKFAISRLIGDISGGSGTIKLIVEIDGENVFDLTNERIFTYGRNNSGWNYDLAPFLVKNRLRVLMSASDPTGGPAPLDMDLEVTARALK